MTYRRVRAVFLKEFRHIIRDPRSLLMALFEPCLMLMLFGYALSLDVDRIPTLVYDADKTPRSRELLQKFEATRFFQIKGYVKDYKEIEYQIDRGRVLMGIVVPQGYGEKIEGAQKTEIQVLIDGSDSNTATIALGYVSGLTRSYAFQLRSESQNIRAGWTPRVPLDLRQRIWYNSTLDSRNYVVPGLIAVMLMIIAALLTSLTIAREWEMGTMEQLMSTPLRPAEIVLGKMLAFFVVGAADAVLAVVVGIFLFHVPFRGDILLLGATTCIFLFGALCWGIFLSAVAKSQLLAYQMGIVTSFLPSMVLSGFVWAIENMPPVIQGITYMVPARYFVTILKGIFLKGVGLEVLWVEVLFLIAFASIVFTGATLKLRQKLA
ncbi:MAG: ABC transporter permease [Bryobacteraceae bacterium]